MTLRLLVPLLFVLSVVDVRPAVAAEAYDNCTGFIDILPAVVSTQGVWCLRHDLAGNLESGTAIQINTNNVTIDCNDFKIGNLAASEANLAIGISNGSRNSFTVRRCNMRGFGYPLFVGGHGALVEDNRVVAARRWAVYATADSGLVRRNHILDTVGNNGAAGIVAVGNLDVVDNTIDTVDAGNGEAWGIYLGGTETGTVRGNRIRGLVAPPEGFYATGILVDDTAADALVQDNYVASGFPAWPRTRGIRCRDVDTFARDNSIAGFETGLMCTDDGGNVVR